MIGVLTRFRTWPLERWLLLVMSVGILALSAVLLLPNTRGEEQQLSDRQQFVEAVRRCRVETFRTLPPGQGMGALSAISTHCYEDVRREALLGEFAIRRATFASQAYQGRVVLWMVVVITLSGVALAALQMLLGFRLAGTGKAGETGQSEVTLEHGKIAVRSSITGLLILVVSFAFFLVYVLWIYTIEEASAVGRAGQPGEASETVTKGSTQPPPPQRGQVIGRTDPAAAP